MEMIQGFHQKGFTGSVRVYPESKTMEFNSRKAVKG
jgi:hypothetical protein